nr:adhesive plaque matrix protein 2-like [Penaeus vannamei]
MAKEADKAHECRRESGRCVPERRCRQSVPNVACGKEGHVCCMRDSVVGRNKIGKSDGAQRNQAKTKKLIYNKKKIQTQGSKKCTKDYGRCKSKCRGHSDKTRACPNGKVCCRNPAKTRSQVIAKANDCTAAGGVCKKPNKKCKEPLSFQCPDKDRSCCKKTTKNNCKSKGFGCVKNCRGTTMKFNGCKEGRVCCKQAQKGNCKQVGGNCKEEAKCNTEVLKPNKPCKDGKICCKKGNNKCKDLGGRCRKEAKCTGQIFTPSIPCKDGNVCCNKENDKCKDLGGRCRKEAKCTGQIFTPSIPCKDGNVCCNKGKDKCKDLGGRCRKEAKCTGQIYYTLYHARMSTPLTMSASKKSQNSYRSKDYKKHGLLKSLQYSHNLGFPYLLEPASDPPLV